MAAEPLHYQAQEADRRHCRVISRLCRTGGQGGTAFGQQGQLGGRSMIPI